MYIENHWGHKFCPSNPAMSRHNDIKIYKCLDIDIFIMMSDHIMSENVE